MTDRKTGARTTVTADSLAGKTERKARARAGPSAGKATTEDRSRFPSGRTERKAKAKATKEADPSLPSG
jgi:hypothetical protein